MKNGLWYYHKRDLKGGHVKTELKTYVSRETTVLWVSFHVERKTLKTLLNSGILTTFVWCFGKNYPFTQIF